MSSVADLAFRDQVLAAHAEARRLLSRADGERYGTPDWLAERLIEVVGTGPFERCPHLTSPQVAFAGTWAPGRIVCWDCADAAPLDVIDRCDLCEPPRPRSGTLVTRSLALVIIAAVCDGCAAVLGRGDLS